MLNKTRDFLVKYENEIRLNCCTLSKLDELLEMLMKPGIYPFRPHLFGDSARYRSSNRELYIEMLKVLETENGLEIAKDDWEIKETYTLESLSLLHMRFKRLVKENKIYTSILGVMYKRDGNFIEYLSQDYTCGIDMFLPVKLPRELFTSIEKENLPIVRKEDEETYIEYSHNHWDLYKAAYDSGSMEQFGFTKVLGHQVRITANGIYILRIGNEGNNSHSLYTNKDALEQILDL